MFLFALLFVPTTAALPPSQSVSDKLLGRMLNSLFKSAFNLKYPPGEKPDACKEKLKASWLLRPPFTTLTNSSGSGDHLDGTFNEVLDVALNGCCAVLKNSANKTFINYKAQPTANISMLHQDILKGEADLILPVRGEGVKYKSFLPYLKILESPGIVLIQRTDSFQRWDGKNILLRNAISSCWPIVVLTLLLSFVVGTGVWAMETKENHQEFGGPFYRGVFDGFWWAFVTMSTVGYGDKTPKSITARLFAVVWIIIGITICSILTATLSSALTNITVKRYDVLAGMRIGAARDSIALQKAVKLGADVTAFEDIDGVYDALVDEQSLDGMLEEMFIATEFLKQKDNSLLSIVHLFEEKHGYGVAFNSCEKFEEPMWSCMSKVIAFVTDDVYPVTNRHIKRTKKPSQHQTNKDVQQPQTHKVFDQKSPVFYGTVIGMCGTTLVFFTISMALKCIRGWRLKNQSEKLETGHEQGKTSHGNWQCPQDGKHLEFTVTELAMAPFTCRKKVTTRITTSVSSRDARNQVSPRPEKY